MHVDDMDMNAERLDPRPPATPPPRPIPAFRAARKQAHGLRLVRRDGSFQVFFLCLQKPSSTLIAKTLQRIRQMPTRPPAPARCHFARVIPNHLKPLTPLLTNPTGYTKLNQLLLNNCVPAEIPPLLGSVLRVVLPAADTRAHHR